MAAAVKRKRNEDEWMTEEYSDLHKTPPSPVVDISGLVGGVKGPDLVKELQGRFGHIVNVLMLQDSALVEYEDMTGSSNLVTYAAKNQMYIFGRSVSINYSKVKKILNLPSRVVYLKFRDEMKVDDTTEADLVAVMQVFGTIMHVVMMPGKHQAFVEYEDGTGSKKAVTYAAKNPVYISGHPVFINYSRQGRTLVSTKNYTPPSTVVYVKFGGKMQVDDITEADLVATMQEFGTVRHALMTKKRQAFVEYEDMTGSSNLVAYAAENMVYILGHPVFINYCREGQRFIKTNKTNVQTFPSPVVEIRDVVPGITESKLVETLQAFGTIKHVLMILKKRQAFVEYEDMTGSSNAVTYAAKNQVYVSGHPVSINYSKHLNLRPYNNVVKFTITNPVYPITTEVLYTVCKKAGPIQRIVISRIDKVVEALVEFDNMLSAERAVAYLHKSKNLQNYSGCSVLIHVMIVDANKPTHLNVSKNDQDTWDYTRVSAHP